MNDDIASLNGVPTSETTPMVTETGTKQDDEETWLYAKQKQDENQENGTVSSMEEPGTQELETEEPSNLGSYPLQTMTSTTEERFDDDSDDDDVQVTIRSDLPKLSGPNYVRTPMNPLHLVAPKPQTRGVDIDGQGTINGQPTMDFDVANALKDDEKPWKKPGADISDYFNYGFTEETWTQYCDRQRRLRNENNIARMNPAPMAPMPPIMPGHLPMMHPMNQMPMMIMSKPPANLQMMARPHMNVRKSDGKIDVIGATDQTSRRPMYDSVNNFDHPPYMNPPGFPGGQPPNGQTVGDLVTAKSNQNGPPTGHSTPPGSNHPIPTLGAHRLPNMPPQGPGLTFRPQFGHPHMASGAPFFSHGPVGPMHGERPPQPYFVPHHPQQAWDKPVVGPPLNTFNLGPFPPVPTVNNPGNGRPGANRSPTPEDHSSRSSTPEENRPIGSIADADKSSKDSRYKDRYRDDQPSLSRHRSSPKEHSSSMFRSRRRSGDHEYERPRNDRKSSRDRDDKYERYPRKRHHRDEGGRHHRGGDDDSSRSHRSSRRTPSKNFSSPPKSLNMNNNQAGTGELPQGVQGENLGGIDNEPTTAPSTSSPNSRSRREDSERSSSRHSHHKKSSKRSRRDSGDERSSSRHHHRRSKEKSSNSKKSSSSTAPDLPSESKDQINE